MTTVALLRIPTVERGEADVVFGEGSLDVCVWKKGGVSLDNLTVAESHARAPSRLDRQDGASKPLLLLCSISRASIVCCLDTTERSLGTTSDRHHSTRAQQQQEGAATSFKSGHFHF